MADSDADAASQTDVDELAEIENASQTEGTLRNRRKIKLGQLTRRMNVIKKLIKDGSSVDEVKITMQKYRELLEEFEIIQGEYQYALNEDERETDHETWYAPKRENHHAFVNYVDKWLGKHEVDDIDPGEECF